MLRTLRAGWVVPVTSPPIRDGLVAIAGDRIAWVGAASDPAAPRGPCEDLGPGVLLPGLVNAHCHLELSWLAGRLAGGDFVGWVAALVKLRVEEREEIARDAAGTAIRGLLDGGTVAVGDVSNALRHLDLLAGAGLRSVVFLEILAWDPARAAASLEWAEARLAGLPPGLRGSGVEVRIAAHAPHSVSPLLLRGLAEKGGPAAIHLAESPAEVEFLRDGGGPWAEFLEERGLGHVGFEPAGRSPVAHLESTGALHAGLLAAHCVQVDAADARRLARSGARAVLCPRSNQTLGVGLPPLPMLQRAGVGLALGSDSLASSPSLDVLEDAALLHRAYPEIDPLALVRMATLGGAEALGLDELGALEPGRLARLAFAPCEEPLGDPGAFLVSGLARPRSLVAEGARA
ncbi:MAG: amidohydrolase family protein [Vicinamibacteria bacterium]